MAAATRQEKIPRTSEKATHSLVDSPLFCPAYSVSRRLPLFRKRALPPFAVLFPGRHFQFRRASPSSSSRSSLPLVALSFPLVAKRQDRRCLGERYAEGKARI
ncbi:hypothetical protein CLOM_g23358 [Closterium sp. NIES-68]|nr:hypothetical protein CLOM_g23358 [Closterium sp. NIES-68]GJP71582.1 hypothetical protein CLOP_g2403 [Closterium sp. NIES-67]